MVYVASSARPIHELLAPQATIDKKLFEQEFVGMTTSLVAFEELAEVRERLHKDIRSRLTDDIAHFLVGLHSAKPDFTLLGLSNACELPAVKWKIRNLNHLKQENPTKHQEQLGLLVELLS